MLEIRELFRDRRGESDSEVTTKTQVEEKSRCELAVLLARALLDHQILKCCRGKKQ